MGAPRIWPIKAKSGSTNAEQEFDIISVIKSSKTQKNSRSRVYKKLSENKMRTSKVSHSKNVSK